jgi:hypothetical protein
LEKRGISEKLLAVYGHEFIPLRIQRKKVSAQGFQIFQGDFVAGHGCPGLINPGVQDETLDPFR